MGKKNKCIWCILLCLLVAVLLLRTISIYVPSVGMVVFHMPETGITVEDPLTNSEMLAVKKILWGRIRWPQSLYGYPACGFGDIYAIILDGVYYMPAWDSCGMIAVKDRNVADAPCRYINISEKQKTILDEIIESRGNRK